MAGRRAVVTSASGAGDFEAFYAGWLVDQQRYLDQLIRLSTQNGDILRHDAEEEWLMGPLIEEMLCHYKRYYEEKEKAMAREDELRYGLLLFFSPPWLTDLEKVFLWVGGFKPSSALGLLEAAVVDMSPEQKGRMEAEREEVEAEAEEMVVEDAKERLHGGVIKAEAMRAVMRMEDMVRRKTVVKAAESLNGRQTVKFFVAVGIYQLGIRSMGIHFPL